MIRGSERDGPITLSYVIVCSNNIKSPQLVPLLRPLSRINMRNLCEVRRFLPGPTGRHRIVFTVRGNPGVDGSLGQSGDILLKTVQLYN